MTIKESDFKAELKACLRPYYVHQPAPIAPAIWTGDAAVAVSVACPICEKMGKMAMVLEDVTGASWGLVNDCFCDTGTGGILGAESCPAQVRAGHVRPSYRHAQGALDRRFERLMFVTRMLPPGADLSFDRELINELEGPDVPSREWIGGGLGGYSDTLLDLSEFDWWQIGRNWETLCVLQASGVSRFIDPGETFDALLAAVDRKTQTGFWSLHGMWEE